MLKALALVSVCTVAVLSDFCKTTDGTWFAGVTIGASDMATAGVQPNDNYFCWEACYPTSMVNQKMKVKLAKNHTQMAPRFINRKALYEKVITGQNANFESCEDHVLREDIRNALTTVTNHSAQAIARTLLYQIGRPNWVYNVVESSSGFSGDNEIFDKNFCLYIHFAGDLLYDIHAVAIDMS